MLNIREYNIAGNQLRAFYDENGGLVFVIDSEINEKKPNVLLVVNSDGDRKWDDILENDYDVDLEDVRPKKDNKYQKLDIEYSGLDLYADLFQAFDSGRSTDDELAQVNLFRDIAVRRAAAERLVTAETQAENAYETIERANLTIEELEGKIRELRVKVSETRKKIGKEPTKQSAAKILKLESQIDAANEKIKRTKKRLASAQKRLSVATDDADAARQLLERVGFNADTGLDNDVPAVYQEKPLAEIESGDLMTVVQPPVPAEIEKHELTTVQTKAEKMADEEVKPLFDTDPEILDEEIAFKPIDFSVSNSEPGIVSQPQSAQGNTAEYSDASAIEPLAFVPPVPPVENNYVEEKQANSVLDSMVAVDTPREDVVLESQTEFMPTPVPPSYTTQPEAAPVAMPVEDVVPAPIDSGFRPVSPITGEAPAVATEEAVVVRNKPTIVYYVMLILLIVLSIFTLWFYQKSVGNNALPSLGGAVMPEVVEEKPEVKADVEESQAPIAEETVQVAIESEKTEVEPEPEPQPEPVAVQPEPQPEPEPEPQPEPVVIDAPVVAVEPTEVPVPVTTLPIRTVPDAPEPEPVKVETDEEILAKKPVYGVSQNEAMFVAADEFETDRQPMDEVIEEEYEAVDMVEAPVVTVTEPAVEYEYEYTDEYSENEVPMCEGGASPDRFGCCPGETYTQIDNGGFVCCPDAGGDCFPPLK